MSTNQDKTRVARIYAPDIAIGDVIVTITGEYVGTVDSVPEVDYANDVRFIISAPDGSSHPEVYKVGKVVRIEIARRPS